MNLTTHLIDDEDRRRIATDAAVSVFVKTGDPEQYVCLRSGNLWPYRETTFSTARTDTTDVKRTRDRTLSLRLVDTRPPGLSLPASVMDVAEAVGADIAQPKISPDRRMGEAIRLFLETFADTGVTSTSVSLGGAPLMKAECAASVTGGEFDVPQVQHVSVPDLLAGDTTLDEAIGMLRSIRDILPPSTDIHVENVYPTQEFAAFLHQNPGLIDSLTIAPEATSIVTAPDGIHGCLNTDGKRFLSDPIDPNLLLAGMVSLFTTDWIAEDSLQEVLTESVLPSVPPSQPIKLGYEQSDSPSTDQAETPSPTSNTDTQGSLAWYQ